MDVDKNKANIEAIAGVLAWVVIGWIIIAIKNSPTPILPLIKQFISRAIISLITELGLNTQPSSKSEKDTKQPSIDSNISSQEEVANISVKSGIITNPSVTTETLANKKYVTNTSIKSESNSGQEEIATSIKSEIITSQEKVTNSSIKSEIITGQKKVTNSSIRSESKTDQEEVTNPSIKSETITSEKEVAVKSETIKTQGEITNSSKNETMTDQEKDSNSPGKHNIIANKQEVTPTLPVIKSFISRAFIHFIMKLGLDTEQSSNSEKDTKQPSLNENISSQEEFANISVKSEIITNPSVTAQSLAKEKYVTNTTIKSESNTGQEEVAKSPINSEINTDQEKVTNSSIKSESNTGQEEGTNSSIKSETITSKKEVGVKSETIKSRGEIASFSQKNGITTDILKDLKSPAKHYIVSEEEVSIKRETTAGQDNVTNSSIIDDLANIDENILKMEITYLKTVINHKNDLIHNLQEKICLLKKAKGCAACHHSLELPKIHFLCEHSFHQHCFQSFSDDENECPTCQPENKNLLELLKAREYNKDLHETFHSQLEKANDGFSVVAEYLSRGVFNSYKIISDGVIQKTLDLLEKNNNTKHEVRKIEKELRTYGAGAEARMRQSEIKSNPRAMPTSEGRLRLHEQRYSHSLEANMTHFTPRNNETKNVVQPVAKNPFEEDDYDETKNPFLDEDDSDKNNPFREDFSY